MRITPRLRRIVQDRHLLFLAHLWLCVPLFGFWLAYTPGHNKVTPTTLREMAVVFSVFVVYLLIRTVLAWRNPPWLRWEYVFPLIDVILVSIALRVRNQPESVLSYTYLIPIAEVVGTLNVRWSALVSALSGLGFLLATWGQFPGPWLGSTGFRLAFLLLLGLLLTTLARQAAELRAAAQVAVDRNRIALEMHDGLQAQLIAVAAQAELAMRLAERDSARTVEACAGCRDGARQAADSIRFLVHRLRPPELAPGFLPALRQYVHQFGERSGWETTLQVTGEEASLAPETELALFRIVQESLTNIRKHADAQRVNATLHFHLESVAVIIEDDGIGFDPVAFTEDSGTGISGMKERARQVGGIFQVESRFGKGAMTRVTVPLRPAVEP